MDRREHGNLFELNYHCQPIRAPQSCDDSLISYERIEQLEYKRKINIVAAEPCYIRVSWDWSMVEQ